MRLFLFKFPLIFSLVFFNINAYAMSAFSWFSSKHSNFRPIPVAKAQDLNPKVLKLAMEAYQCAQHRGLDKKHVLTIIDYSLPSSAKRLWVVDVKRQKVLYHTFVAHGKYSGGRYATNFSDKNGSKESSLGVFLTDNTYYGHRGYSLRLSGLEKGINDNALKRDIVVHGAFYVSKNFIHRYNQVGRSWGCPAVPVKQAKPIINTIKNGTLVFAYYPQYSWLNNSKFLHCSYTA